MFSKFNQCLKIFLTNIFENPNSKLGKAFNLLLIALITISVGFFIFETTPLGQSYQHWFHVFDYFVVILFSIEYLVRFYLSGNRLKFIASPLALIDLLVIFSFYISVTNFAFLRGFRVLKILQLLKIFRYSEVLGDFFRSFRNYRNEFRIFTISLGIVLLLSSCGLYYLEQGINPKINTIPDAIWWAVVTVSTVGYGDITPVTWAGKILAGFMMFMGLGIIAIFTAIITKMFIDHFFGKKNHKCNFCHYPRHDFDAQFCKNCGNSLDMNADVSSLN